MQVAKYYSVARKKQTPSLCHSNIANINKNKPSKKKQQTIKEQVRKQAKDKNIISSHILGVTIPPDNTTPKQEAYKNSQEGMSSLTQIILAGDISQIPIIQKNSSLENSQQQYFDTSQTKNNDIKNTRSINSTVKKFQLQPTVVSEAQLKMLPLQDTYQSLQYSSALHQFKKPSNLMSKLSSEGQSKQYPYLHKVSSQGVMKNYRVQQSSSRVEVQIPNSVIQKQKYHLRSKHTIGDEQISALVQKENENLKKLRSSKPIIHH